MIEVIATVVLHLDVDTKDEAEKVLKYNINSIYCALSPKKDNKYKNYKWDYE